MKRIAKQTVARLLVFSSILSTSCFSRPEWTTTSEEALREFELGQEAKMKLYAGDAAEHFARALELDPDFVAAKLAMGLHGGYENGQQWKEELRTVDREALSDREKFLIDLFLARNDQRYSDVDAILERYAELAPDDPYALAALGEEAWRRQAWQTAAAYYQRLLEVEPNWVLAQNHLGYLAMAQGRFAEAEEHFETYGFVAPDQANPHDSMGELLTVTGRYEEALASLEEAIAVRADFCASYMHMLDILVLEGRPYDGHDVLERAEAHCGGDEWKGGIAVARCELAFWTDYLEGEFDSPWREDRGECRERVGPRSFLVHRLAALSGRWDAALAAEKAMAEDIEGRGGVPDEALQRSRGVLRHLEGVRLLAQGEADRAVEKLRQADSLLWYWGQNQGILKLFNRLNLVYALELSGRESEAEALLEEVAGVNRPFAEAYPDIRANFAV